MTMNNNDSPAKRPKTAAEKRKRMQFEDVTSIRGNLDAIPFPAQQPTHSGYLVSATLLPTLTAP